MRTLARIVVVAAVVLVVLVVGAIVAIKTIDPNTLIAPVQAQVKSLTGRDLSVRGTAHIALSLHPRIVLTDVVLSNAPWGVAKDLARIERLELAAALMPLFARRFELEEIVLQKPVVALETDGKGQKNWQAPGAGAAPAQGGAAPSLASAIAIGNVTIADGVFTYQDGPKAAVSRVFVERLSMRSRALGSGVELDFRGSVGELPLAVAGTIGDFEALVARKSPFPVDVKGQAGGQPFAIATRIKAEPSRYAFEDLKVALGANAMSGSFAADTSGPRPKLVFDLAAPSLALSGVPLPAVPTQPAPAVPAKAGRAYMIPDTSVSFAPLRWVDADGKLAIGKLIVGNGQALSDVQLAFTNVDARFDMPRFSVGAFGGTLSGSAKIDASRSDAPALNVHIEGKDLSLGALLSAAGHPREVRGGSTDLAVDLAMRGDSPHDWASSATGNVRVVSGKATLVNSKIDPAMVFDKLTEAINPFRNRDPSTELLCAVVRFPIANGVARVDRSIAMETDKLGVSASGTLDFRNETLDFQFNPKVRKGISIDFAGFSDLVRVTGPFAAPHVAIDAAGSAKVIASVGAAISTGGLSAVAQGLFSWADGSGPGPCKVALEGGSARTETQGAAPAAAQPAVPAASEIGKALGRLFGR